MKKLPILPYIQNIVAHYHNLRGGPHPERGIRICEMYGISEDVYPNWLRQFGFTVPIDGDYLEFPDDFPDEKITLFVLRWS